VFLQPSPPTYGIEPSQMERVAAYEGILSSMPTSQAAADLLVQRTDGTSAAGIVEAIGFFRRDLQARLGAIAEPEAGLSLDAQKAPMGSSPRELAIACQIVIGCLPLQPLWAGALAARMDGASASGVISAITAYKKELQVYLSELPDEAFRTTLHLH
jgi:hypothetical protein